MRKTRAFLLVILSLFLLLPSWLAVAEPNSSKSNESIPTEPGTVSSKDEVVYARLSATGEKEEIYVVNILNIDQAGTITDHGFYTHLKNLTNLSPVEQQDNNTVVFSAPEGKFYYQGNMDEESLPWDISIAYQLDGVEITPEELAGKDGQVRIRIGVSANETVDPVFFENYLLQISVSLDQSKFTNVQAPDGMAANAGMNQQITFTVMPRQEKELTLEADAVGFEMEGIDIAAIPSTLPIDAPDIDEMVGDMDLLTDAIQEIHNGVAELLDGIAQMNSGTGELRDGSKQYHDGITALQASSGDLVSGSASIGEALTTLSQALGGGLEEADLGGLQQLEEALLLMAGGLQEIPQGLKTLNEHHNTALQTLDQAMESIPNHEISEEAIQQLYGSGADPAVLEQLLETYAAALTAKGTFTAVKPGFEAVDGTLEQIQASLTEMAGQMSLMAEGLSSPQEGMDIADSMAELQEGISTLALHYQEFQSGLEQFSGGLSQLSGSYGQIHEGIEELSTGTGELENGVRQLHDGTAELASSTRDLPEQMRAEASQMMADYDKSDFEVVSFVSPQNENINSVQFVLRTEGIKTQKPEASETPVEEKEGFWARFVNLFRFND